MGYVRSHASLVERRLDEMIPSGEINAGSGSGSAPRTIVDAMRYSLFSGGKRLRPVMCVAAWEAVGAGGGRAAALDVACAIEMIHTYSLIHDDLPCMDDDDFRRGKPTTHQVFGEAVAVLVGDALLTLGFEVIARAAARARGVGRAVMRRRLLEVVIEVASAAGPSGMVGGQVIDIGMTAGKAADEATIERMNVMKTARLFSASVSAGAMVAGASGAEISALRAFARDFGLGFQIADDISDAAGERDSVKASYVRALGIEGARRVALESIDRAVAHLDYFGERVWALRGIAGLTAAKVAEGARER